MILCTEDDSCGQVDCAKGPCTKNVVPNPTDSLKARKHMSEPGKYPWNDEYQEFGLLETVKNRFKLPVLGHYKIQNNFAQHNSDMADIELEKVMEIDFARFLHHVVADVVSEYGEKY